MGPSERKRRFPQDDKYSGESCRQSMQGISEQFHREKHENLRANSGAGVEQNVARGPGTRRDDALVPLVEAGDQRRSSTAKSPSGKSTSSFLRPETFRARHETAGCSAGRSRRRVRPYECKSASARSELDPCRRKNVAGDRGCGWYCGRRGSALDSMAMTISHRVAASHALRTW